MKNTKLLLLAFIYSGISFSQSINIQNMINYLRSKEFDKAKAAADAAAVHDDTKNAAKMWINRGKVYQAIYADTSAKVRALDNEAEEKALQAYITCLTIDKGKDIYKDDAKGPLVQAASATNRKATYYTNIKEYDKAIKCYDMLETAIPFDFDNGIKRQNITNEKLMFYRFETYKNSANKEKTKEYANKLIEAKYKEPKIYTDLVKLSLIDKDTASALNYIEKGKLLFEDNMELINAELNIYLARKKTDELKAKLEKAIAIAPDNEVLHNVLGNLYNKTKQLELAEKEYAKAIELKSDYADAYYNLAVIYYNQGKEWNDKLNAAAPKDPKIKEYETKFNDAWTKAATNFEGYYDLNTKDLQTKKLLLQIHTRLGNTEKAAKYK
jgi:tetratricopeptide (TPR) repeat protein